MLDQINRLREQIATQLPSDIDTDQCTLPEGRSPHSRL